MFLNIVFELIVECILVFCVVLIIVEYLVFYEDYYVLVIMIDMISYCEVLREFLFFKGEIFGCKGYFGYMYLDFLLLYECVGMIEGKFGLVI